MNNSFLANWTYSSSTHFNTRFLSSISSGVGWARPVILKSGQQPTKQSLKEDCHRHARGEFKTFFNLFSNETLKMSTLRRARIKASAAHLASLAGKRRQANNEPEQPTTITTTKHDENSEAAAASTVKTVPAQEESSNEKPRLAR